MRKNTEIMVPSKSLSNFCRTREISLVNCEMNHIMTDTKLYVPVVTFGTQDNGKLLQQGKSCFKRKINWNNYQSKATI